MDSSILCPNCGSRSDDPQWCDVCGAELKPRRNNDRWLARGDVVHVQLTPPPSGRRARKTRGGFGETGDTGERPTVSGFTLTARPTSGSMPAVDGGEQDPTAPFVPVFSDEDTDPGAAEDPDTLGMTLMPDDAPSADTGDTMDETPGSASLRLEEPLTSFPTRKVWRAVRSDGTSFRVEERRADGTNDDPLAVTALPELIDAPVGRTRHGGHEIKVSRYIDGQLLTDRLETHPEPLSPRELLEWLIPVAEAVQEMHDNGYICLRVCPFSIKYRDDGGVFLENVEGLYPADVPLTAVPAITGYSAPEIYEPNTDRMPSFASDIYSLTMLGYYMVARQDPPSTAASGYLPALLARDYAPSFPLGLAPFFAYGGAAEPAQRPKSAIELVQLLDACVRNTEERARPGGDGLHVHAAAETHTGIRKRLKSPVNQDSIFLARSEDRSHTILCVADGVSTATYGSGDLASQILVQTVSRAWENVASNGGLADLDAASWLSSVLQEANRGILEYVNRRYAPFDGNPHEVMGSTALIALIRGCEVSLISLGDSRAYLMREGYIEQITRDHNLLTLGIVDGLSPDIALGLPQAEALARCLGNFEVDEDGSLVPNPVQPDFYEFRLQLGDRLLLCSDGLTDYAGEDIAQSELSIYETIIAERNPEIASLELLVLANRGGGGDNIAVGLCTVLDTPLYEEDAIIEETTEDIRVLHPEDVISQEVDPDPDEASDQPRRDVQPTLDDPAVAPTLDKVDSSEVPYLSDLEMATTIIPDDD